MKIRGGVYCTAITSEETQAPRQKEENEHLAESDKETLQLGVSIQ